MDVSQKDLLTLSNTAVIRARLIKEKLEDPHNSPQMIDVLNGELESLQRCIEWISEIRSY